MCRGPQPTAIWSRYITHMKIEFTLMNDCTATLRWHHIILLKFYVMGQLKTVELPITRVEGKFVTLAYILFIITKSLQSLVVWNFKKNCIT